MLFLVEYDRTRGEIASFESFGDTDREEAEDRRLELELDLSHRGIEHEVVLLEAASKEALRRTHRRYFEDLAELATPLSG
jgi:hypothetical protein